jgi:hypothetical protein
MTSVLNWIKANVIIVILVVVMIAALIGLPLLSMRMNDAIKRDVASRISRNSKIEAAGKLSIDVGGGTREITPNPGYLDEWKAYSKLKKEDAERIHALAIEHNRKERGVIMPELFPDPPRDRTEVLPEQFHGLLVQAYEDLLQRIRAGSPPTHERLLEELSHAEAQFRTNDLKLGDADALTDEQMDLLRHRLTRTRLDIYGQTAQQIGVYASLEGLAVPVWVQTYMPSMNELFDWQWQFWTTEDLLLAVADANMAAPSVVTAPVKRVISILPFATATPTGGGAASGDGPGMRGTGTAGRGRIRPPEEEAGGEGLAASGDGDATAPPNAGAPFIDATAAAPLDFNATFTGRVPNALYDVRTVEMRLIVETARIPHVLDAIARRNFITVVDLDLVQANPYEAIRAGYFFGDAPISELTLTLETIWLREWTAPLMPQSLRAALNIKPKPVTG